MKKDISIKRNRSTVSPTEQRAQLAAESPYSITLASNSVTESDPLKLEIGKRGYKIISENEYGVKVQKSQGKPSFLARTVNGYFEPEKPTTLLLPESLNTTMKVHIAGLNINAQQYLTQLIMKDLREKNLLQ